MGGSAASSQLISASCCPKAVRIPLPETARRSSVRVLPSARQRPTASCALTSSLHGVWLRAVPAWDGLAACVDPPVRGSDRTRGQEEDMDVHRDRQGPTDD